MDIICPADGQCKYTTKGRLFPVKIIDIKLNNPENIYNAAS